MDSGMLKNKNQILIKDKMIKITEPFKELILLKEKIGTISQLKTIIQSSPSDSIKDHTPIHSLINGTIVKLGDHKEKHYGLHIIISDANNRLFLLGHLSEYASDLKIGSIVYPGKVIGTVGNSGNCYTDNHKITSEERAEGKGSHLHLSFYKTEKPISKLFVNDNFITYYMENEIFESVLFNPFSHNEERNFK